MLIFYVIVSYEYLYILLYSHVNFESNHVQLVFFDGNFLCSCQLNSGLL